ncbi:metallophosphoesterase [Hydrogenophaga sp. 5NK40-0174]|uniref:metallophosphoesterase n=1 Tax=Hydrogenophaga sp. 5NK40-0174 TaxID=3127649 RepID=UPI00310647F7
MKLQLLSDLHLEANPDFRAEPAPDADALILAGDIGSYQVRRDGSIMDEPDWGLQRFSPLPQFAAWPVPVFFVPGNHEYDALDIDVTHAQLRHACDRLGIGWLEKESVVFNDVRLIGSTLWSDYDAIALHQHAQGTETQRLKQREKAFRAANFYLEKMAGERHGKLFDAEAMRELGLQSQHWLEQALDEAADAQDGRPVVVVTHFAPTLDSADPRYGLTPGTAGFCNALPHLLPKADLWLHGHLHCPTDVQIGRCRIVANPLGYADKGEQATFDPLFTVDCNVRT